METAKVDVRKLQMLNDRINQTIDALHQVRLSVHGMSTNGNGAAYLNGNSPFTTPYAGAAWGVPGPVPGIGWGHPAQAQQHPYLQQLQLLQQLQQQQGYYPFGQTYGAAPYGGINNPINPWGGGAWGAVGYGDPYGTGRIAQTFPFVQWGYSPIASASWPYASQMS
jgi:hypothetical protein